MGIAKLSSQGSYVMMEDFHSSMFWVSGMFGLSMFVAGLIAIKVYPKIFPIE
jgi:hypothetical protein